MDDSNIVNFEHNVMAVRISSEVIEERGDIYSATRYAWKASLDKCKAAQYVLAVSKGKVIGVFKPTKWFPSTDKEFKKFDLIKDRYGFKGEVASSEILAIYFGKYIPDMIP